MNGEICLLNDSFPPLIDGVANTVLNYAVNLTATGHSVSVATPDCPGAEDNKYPFPILRYPSIDLRKQIGYPAGRPFSRTAVNELSKRDICLLHSHCPAASQLLAREVREKLNIPLIMTYHTKFDIDIADILPTRLMQEGAIRALVENVSASDELWVVSRGAGENIRSLGYTGDYVVMENGVDLPRQRATEEEVQSAVSNYDLPEGVPVFLFVGRLMWYKGLKIILDALAALRSQNLDFRMIIVGKGSEEKEIKAYCSKLKLDNKCFFTGPIYDRRVLSGWYTRANLFLFPSTFDTNGLVVREAAACSLGTVLIEGSCAAENITNGRNGLLIEENAASLAVCLSRIMDNREAMRRIGDNAASELYMSWADSVAVAAERYELVLERHRSGLYPKHHRITDELLAHWGSLQTVIEKANERFERRLF